MRADAMRCEDCGTIWYSRVAALIVAKPDLARCVRCQGRLVLDATSARRAEDGQRSDGQRSEAPPR